MMTKIVRLVAIVVLGAIVAITSACTSVRKSTNAASIVLNPTTAASGASIDVSGSGLALNATITIKLDGVKVGTTYTGGAGRFCRVTCSHSATVTAPSAGGSHRVSASDPQGGVATAVLTVSGQPSPPPSGSSVPALNHVFIILEENQSYGTIIGNSSAPYINSLASKNALNTNYSAITHPSLPNYLALTGASTFGISTDCLPTACPVKAPNIADRVESAGKTWRAYMESMPSPCYLSDSGEYAPKHNPFVYYEDIQGNASRCQIDDVPYSQLATDLKSASTTPNYVWITPNLIDDMHDGSVAQGDSWLKSNLPTIFNSPAWTTQKSALFIVWDEDDGSGNNHVASLIVSPLATAGYRSGVAYNHYSLMRTVELALGLSAVARNDARAAPMTGEW